MLNKKNAFTIIDVIVAVFVITVGVLAAYNVTQEAPMSIVQCTG